MPSPEPDSEHRDLHDDGQGGLLSRRHRSRRQSPEERLAQFVEERQREFDEQAARFEQTLAELEQRELFLSDTKASIERLLRLGSKELDAREAELLRLMDELTEREARVHELEEELAHRRSELGAVELKRLVVEQRERALEARETVVAEAEERVVSAPPAPAADAVTLAFVPGPRYALHDIEPVSLEPGDPLVVDGEEYVLLRRGRSPLPGDRRRCAYLVRGPRAASGPSGSS